MYAIFPLSLSLSLLLAPSAACCRRFSVPPAVFNARVVFLHASRRGERLVPERDRVGFMNRYLDIR